MTNVNSRRPPPSDPSGPGDEPILVLDRAPETAVADLSSLYKLLVESVRDYAIFALDATGHIITWNPGAARFKGYTAQEIIGQHFSVFYPPEDQAARKPRCLAAKYVSSGFATWVRANPLDRLG